jgi:RES domain.
MKVCADCFRDTEIKQFIKSNSSETGQCRYCSRISQLIELDEIADFFDSLLSIYVENSDGIELYKILQQDWNLFSFDSNVENIISDIIRELGLSFSSSLVKVVHIEEIDECISFWDILKEDLKKRKRYLSNITEYGWDTLFDVNSIIDKRTLLYRARIHHSINEEKPFKIDKMGCPPMSLSEGRANPRGIPYLYLAKEIETTYYETRAIYLDYISIGIFKVKDNINLKITDFTKRLSPFNNSTNIVEFTKGVLLRSIISRDLSKPLHRFDSDLEYIPTQFICEFIRYICGSDGVQFFSSLKEDGVNLVLFEEDKVSCQAVELHQVTRINIDSKIIPF